MKFGACFWGVVFPRLMRVHQFVSCERFGVSEPRRVESEPAAPSCISIYLSIYLSVNNRLFISDIDRSC